MASECTQKRLVLTPLSAGALTGDEYYLGAWCLPLDKLIGEGAGDQNLIPYHWADPAQRERDYDQIAIITEKYIQALSSSLADLHQSDKSERYWRFLVSRNLVFLIAVIFDRYQVIKSAESYAEDNNIRWTYSVSDEGLGDLVQSEFIQMFSTAVDDPWNEFVFTKIINLLDGAGDRFERSSSGNLAASGGAGAELLVWRDKKLAQNGLKRAASQLIGKASRIGDYVGSGVSLANPGFGAGPTMSLYRKMRSFSIVRFPTDMKPAAYDIGTRSALKMPAPECEFDDVLNQILRLFLPKEILEEFEYLGDVVKEISPIHPKKILTGPLFSPSVAHRWIAERVESGAKLSISQHGGLYGTGRTFAFEDLEVASSDTFFSWGWRDQRPGINVVPMPSIKLSSTMRNLKSTASGPILITTTTNPRYAYHPISIPSGPSVVDDICTQVSLIDRLCESHADLVKLRLAPNAPLYFDEKSFWINAVPNLLLSDGKLSLFEELERSRLYICTHATTTYLETMAANYPTILYWSKELWPVRPHVERIFEALEEANILFYDAKRASEFVQSIQVDSNAWWHRRDVQRAKSEFLLNYGMTAGNWNVVWARALRRM